MNKKLLFVALIVLIGFALLYWGRQNSAETGTAIVSSSVTSGSFGDAIPFYDFGEVSMARGKVAHDFEISNETDGDILIRRAFTSCMCTQAFLRFQSGENLGPFGMPGHGPMPLINRTVQAGETITVQTVFDPAAHGPAGIGLVEREIVLQLENGEYRMRFKAYVTP